MNIKIEVFGIRNILSHPVETECANGPKMSCTLEIRSTFWVRWMRLVFQSISWHILGDRLIPKQLL